ncbi:MAG: hypothetical protein H6737_18780 [Alphaproteobacteria bacterium]|nr:hypothetical protein [Alphaproteobacteria bacterium]
MAFARQPLVELVALAALLGVVWRGEVEWHGWDGLRWVGYFHWAVPVGGIAFLAWLASTPVVRAVGRRWGLLGIALPHAVLSIWLTHECLFGMFNRFAVGAPFFLLVLFANAFFAPVVAWGVGRVLHHPLPAWSLLASVTLSVGTPFLAYAALGVIDPLHADAIHAVKTGMAVPFVVLAFGLPWAVAPLPEPYADPD